MSNSASQSVYARTLRLEGGDFRKEVFRSALHTPLPEWGHVTKLTLKAMSVDDASIAVNAAVALGFKYRGEL